MNRRKNIRLVPENIRDWNWLQYQALYAWNIQIVQE
jgi:hypothetical protein